MDNPYAWLFLSVLSIFSVIFAIWTWCAGKQRKEISVQCKSDILIKAGKNQIKKLDVLYDGNPIEDLTSSKFFIWNSGNQVLQRNDIVSARPIAIRSEKAKLLDAQILRMSDPTSGFSVQLNSNQEAQVDFEYVEAGNGILVQILHTGDALSLEFDCKIKGGNDVRDCTAEHKNRKISFRDKFLDFVATDFPAFVILGCLLGAVLVAPTIVKVEPGVPMSLNQFIGYVGILIASGWFGLKLSSYLIRFAKRVYNRSVPQSLLNDKKKEKG